MMKEKSKIILVCLVVTNFISRWVRESCWTINYTRSVIKEDLQLLEKFWACLLALPNFISRLARENRWTITHTRRVIDEYIKFIILATESDHPVTPSDAVDQVWHSHLTYTHEYWEKFCPKVLGKALHHQPTAGGEQEKTKYQAQYSKTLALYRQRFGEEPPANIWPDPKKRFGLDLHFVRVNEQSHWLVPKAKVYAISAMLALVAVMITGNAYAGELPDSMNLLDQLGTALPLLIGMLSVTFGTWQLMPKKSGKRLDLPLSSEELAYLAGWENRLLETGLFGLMQRGIISLGPDLRTFRIDTPGTDLSLLEQHIISSIGSGNTIAGIRLYLPDTSAKQIRSRLKNLGLMTGLFRSETYWFNPFAIVIACVLIVYNNPLGWMILIFFVFHVFRAGFFRLTSLRHTHYGNKVLAYARSKAIDKETPQDLLPAMALFGPSALSGTAYAELRQAFEIGNSSTNRNNGTTGYEVDGGCGGCGGCG